MTPRKLAALAALRKRRVGDYVSRLITARLRARRQVDAAELAERLRAKFPGLVPADAAAIVSEALRRYQSGKYGMPI